MKYLYFFFLAVLLQMSSSHRLNDEVQTLVYSLQQKYCGGQFCIPDPSYPPPACPATTPTPSLGNGTETRESFDYTKKEPTANEKEKSRNISRCDPCLQCSCDDSCVLLGTCCADKRVGGDYFIDCQPIESYDLDNGEIAYSWYEIVTRCFQDAQNYSQELADLCENGELGYVQDGRLVTTHFRNFNTSVTFRNKYCAMCYGLTNYTPWNVYLNCYSDLSDSQNYTDINALIRYGKASDDCVVASTSPPNLIPSECSTSRAVVSTCNVTGKWGQYNENMETACHSYFNPTLNWKYKNIVCYLCNGEPEEELECPSNCHFKTVKGVSLMPFAALLNFQNSDVEILKSINLRHKIKRIGKQKEHQCRKGDIYDARSMVCREIFCPLGEEGNNSTCTALVSSPQFVFTAWNATAYYDNEIIVPLRTESPFLGYAVVDALKEELERFGFSLWVFVVSDFAAIKSRNSLRITESQFDLTLFLLTNFSLEEARNRLQQPISLNITWNLKRIGVRVVSEYKVLTDKLSIDSVPYAFEKHVDMQNIDITSAIAVPLSFNVSCFMLRLINQDVDVLNDTVSVNGNSMTKQDYFSINDGEYFVCLEVLFTERETAIEPNQTSLSADFLVGRIVTGVCLSFSLLFLLLTVLVYLSIKDLQTVPGINLIFLAFSLFVAQIFYLFGSGTVTTPTICTVIGVLIHYFWLVSFAWMNICCLHMFRVFTNLYNSLRFADNKACLVLKYSAFAYGTPLVLVACTLITTYITSDYKRVSYGGATLCFLSPGLVSVVSFGVPVGVSVLINAVFLVITALYLKRASRVIGAYGRPESNDISKYFKLSTISGLSWLLGFLGYFLERVELLYLFTVLTAGQGVFIFLSFVGSRRIMRLLANRFSCLQRKRQNNKHTSLNNTSSGSQISAPSSSQTTIISRL